MVHFVFRILTYDPQDYVSFTVFKTTPFDFVAAPFRVFVDFNISCLFFFTKLFLHPFLPRCCLGITLGFALVYPFLFVILFYMVRLE